MKKVVLIVLILVVIVVTVAASYVKFALPDVGDAPELKVEITPERVKNGEYLAMHVSMCMDCHSTRDWSKFAGPLVEGTIGKGGEEFNEDMGFPGTFFSRNITPFNLKNWTDGEIFRVITTGVNKSGRALFPVMPYLYYGKMDKEDVYDIIAYLRTLEPIENVTQEPVLNFPMNFIVNTIPAKPQPMIKPAKSDTLKYGAYLVNQAACLECHTKVEKGQVIPELAFSGGRLFNMPNGELYSANITPDKETGIGDWSAETFGTRFKLYSDQSALNVLAKDQVNTIMPWGMLAGMDTSDLRSIYAYLQSLEPVKNNVVHFVEKKN